MRRDNVDNKKRQAKLLAEMAVGHDWGEANKRVDAVASENRDSDLDRPVDGIAVAVQHVDEPGYIPNLLYAQGTQEVVESVARDLSANDPSPAEAARRIREATIWRASDETLMRQLSS